MIQTVNVTNYLDESIALSMTSPATTGLFIKSIDGLGPVKATINTMEILSLDGGFFNSAKAQMRNIVMKLGFMHGQAESVELLRHKTYQYFPLKTMVVIEVETDIQTLSIAGYVESNEPNVFSNQSDTTISILCPWPHWFDGVLHATLLAGNEALFEYPFATDLLTLEWIEFGSIADTASTIVDYTGNIPVGVQIHVEFGAAATGVEIYDATHDVLMAFDDTLVADIMAGGFLSGDEIMIDTRVGQKTITGYRSSVAYNLLNAYMADETNAGWFTLHPGDNEFSVDATTGLSSMQVELYHYDSLVGV